MLTKDLILLTYQYCDYHTTLKLLLLNSKITSHIFLYTKDARKYFHPNEIDMYLCIAYFKKSRENTKALCSNNLSSKHINLLLKEHINFRNKFDTIFNKMNFDISCNKLINYVNLFAVPCNRVDAFCHSKLHDHDILSYIDEIIFIAYFENNLNIIFVLSCKYGMTKLFDYVLSLDFEKIKLDIDMGFTYAATNGHFHILKKIFKIDPSIKTRIKTNLALITIVKHKILTDRHHKIINYLIKKGIDIYFMNYDAFIGCAINNHLDTLKLLYKFDNDDKKKFNIIITTALEYSASNGHLEIVQFLIGTKSVTITNILLTKLLKPAIRAGHLHIIDYLYQIYPGTFLLRIEDIFLDAVILNKKNIVDYLFKNFTITLNQLHSLDNYTDITNIAIENNYSEILELLINNGAIIDIDDNMSKIIVTRNYVNIVRILIKYDIKLVNIKKLIASSIVYDNIEMSLLLINTIHPIIKIPDESNLVYAFLLFYNDNDSVISLLEMAMMAKSLSIIKQIFLIKKINKKSINILISCAINNINCEIFVKDFVQYSLKLHEWQELEFIHYITLSMKRKHYQTYEYLIKNYVTLLHAKIYKLNKMDELFNSAVESNNYPAISIISKYY